MKQEYTNHETEATRVTVRLKDEKSSAIPVSDNELTEAERRRKSEQTSDIDSRYIEMFCNRYHDRGIAGKVHADAARQKKQEALTRAKAPGAYVATEKLSHKDIVNRYRNGEADGQKYMTVQDFDKFYHDQRDYKFPDRRVNGKLAPRHDTAEMLVEPVTVSAEELLPKKAVWLTDTDKLPSFLRKWADKTWFRRINEWAGETFPRESHMVKANKKPISIPVGVVAGLVVVTVSMSLVIGGTVLVSRSTREVSELKDTLAQKQAIHSELSDRLDLKNDLLGIKDIAVDTMGMVGEEYVNGQYVDNQSEDYLEVYGEGSDETEKSGWAAILSAFGFGRD